MSITKSTACNHDIADYYLKNLISNTSSTSIHHCTDEIDLDVVIETNLSFSNHISLSINETNKLLGVIRRSFCALDNASFTLFYKAVVQLHLEYDAIVWNPCKKGYIDDLEKVQRMTTKLLRCISHLSYPSYLAALNLATLAYCCMRGDMISSKILSNIYDSRVTNFLSKSNFLPARGHGLKLFVQHANINVRKWFLSICIVFHRAL